MLYDQELVELIKGRFSNGIELTFVDYDDQLSDEQAVQFITGDDEKLFDSILEWESENRWYGTDWYVDELVSHIQDGNPDFEPDYEWLDAVRDILMDLDESDPLGELVKRTTTPVTMCKWLIDEDNAVWGLHDVDELVSALGVPDTVKNRKLAAELINNAATDLGMAFSAYEVAPADFPNGRSDLAAIRTDQLPVCYGNPFTGAYWVGTFELSGVVEVPIRELSPEGHLTPYGPSEVFGGFPDELECETEVVVTKVT